MIEVKLYYMKEVGEILDKYCSKNEISSSEFVRHSVLMNIANKETDEKIKKRCIDLTKRIEMRWQSESLKYHMSRAFFALNASRKLAHAISCCEDKNILLALIDEYKEIANITENKKAMRMLVKLRKGLKTQKEFDAVRAEFRDYILAQNKNTKGIERRIKQ